VPPSFRDLVDQFLTASRTFEFETEAFVTMKHDRDLVTGFDTRLARIAESYGYFTALSFETQGINDAGSDVSVRYRDLGVDPDGPHRVLGFQLKSHVELTVKDVVSTIKAQRDDAFRKIPDLAHYYIVLCGFEQQLKKRFNAVRAEFLHAPRTTVVSPVQALRFLRYELYQIDSRVKRGMDESDIVLREMRQSLDGLSDTAKVLVCSMAARVISYGSTTIDIGDLASGPVGRAYQRVIEEAQRNEARVAQARAEAEMYDRGDEIDEREDDGDLEIASLDPATAIAVDLEQLEGDFVEQSHNGNQLSLLLAPAAAVLAVASDAVVRYGYTGEGVVPYLLDLAGVEA
jgi:hypothetical protein